VPFFESKPSFLLFLSSILVVLAGFVIVFTPLGKSIGFVAPQMNLILILLLIIAVYLITVQVVKNWFIRKYDYE